MAGPALLPNITPDITVKRAESSPPSPGPRDTGAPERESAFERARQDAAKAERGDAPAKDESKSRPEPARADETSPDNANAVVREPRAPEESRLSEKEEVAGELLAPAGAVKESASPEPDGTAFALALPVAENGPVPGKGLPVAVGLKPAPAPKAGGEPAASAAASPSKTLDLQQLFIQKNMTAGAPGTEAGKSAAANPKLAGLDLKSFKASLAETIDPRGGSSTETSPTAPATPVRSLELKEGSTLLRQYSTSVDTPVQQGEWGEKVAGKISWLASQRISFAEIHLNPADLGPVEVRVHVQNDQASVVMHAQNSSVRDLLELNGQRLRDMMQDNGLNLAKMDVSDQPAQQQAGEGGSGEGGSSAHGEGDPSGLVSLEGESITTGEIHLQWNSQVDIYA